MNTRPQRTEVLFRTPSDNQEGKTLARDPLLPHACPWTSTVLVATVAHGLGRGDTGQSFLERLLGHEKDFRMMMGGKSGGKAEKWDNVACLARERG